MRSRPVAAGLLLRLTLLCLLAVTSAFAEISRKELLEALERLPHPDRADEFAAPKHLAGWNQGDTSICWSYSTDSFIQSEMARLKLPMVRLSVMYPAYCEFIEKARRYVRNKGNSRFDPGDLFTGVPEVCQKYGALPAGVFDQQTEQKLPDHGKLYAELRKLMNRIKQSGDWDEERALTEVRAVLDQHLGKPPESFEFEDHTYTPKSFASEKVKLPWADYTLLTSFEYAPFNTYTEFKVPDNWHHNTNYLNLPLAVFYDAFKSALRAGYTIAVSIDTTEPSYRVTGRYGFIAESEIPLPGITQDLRENLFQRGSTTDDHAIHILGYHEVQGEDWFLAQDSWKSTWRDGNQGRLFLHSSYVKLKILAFMVHRDGVATLLDSSPRP